MLAEARRVPEKQLRGVVRLRCCASVLYGGGGRVCLAKAGGLQMVGNLRASPPLTSANTDYRDHAWVFQPGISRGGGTCRGLGLPLAASFEPATCRLQGIRTPTH